MSTCMRTCALLWAFVAAPVDAQKSSSERSQHAHSHHGHALDLAAREPDDSEPTQLPPIVVTPDDRALPSLRHDWALLRIQRSLPGIGTDAPRPKTNAEKITDALGLTGEGVQALHAADQERLAGFADRLNAEPE